MGLSNEERYTKMLYSAKSIYNLGLQLQNELTIKNKTRKIWIPLLGGISNGLHWIMGSETSVDLKSASGPYSVALSEHFAEASRDDDEFFHSSEFDPFRGFIDEAGIIGRESRDLRRIFEIYTWIEEAVYALRRYEDEFLEEHKAFSEYLAELTGLCFIVFDTHDIYAKAYLITRICKVLYKNKTIEGIARDDCWHHHLPTIAKRPLSYIMKMHKYATDPKHNSTMHLLIVCLLMMGKDYHYDHLYKKLIEYLDKSRAKYNRKLLDFIFKNLCQAPHVKEEEDDRKSYRAEHKDETKYFIHGF